MKRQASVERKTRETEIVIKLDLDGAGLVDVATGVPFMDHMLAAFARHGLFDLRGQAKGDLEIDAHHTLEDLGLTLGQALREALGTKAGIQRFGSSLVPMDEALAQVAIDLSGRPHLSYDVKICEAVVGGVPVRLFREFFQALVNAAGMTMHISLLAGEEGHHSLEAVFKAFGRALDKATQPETRGQGIPSTKGMLE